MSCRRLALPQMIILLASALGKAVFLSDNLVVNETWMRENVAASNGLMLAEALDLALAPHIGREQAKKLVKAAAQTALKTNRHLVEVVWEAVSLLLDWDRLRDETHYLGASQDMIDRVLDAVKKAGV